MKKQLLSLALLSAAWLAGGSAFALDQDADGYYLIGSKADLLEWKDISGYEATKVKLTTDIEDWTFMFAENASFTGEFDGQGHTITINMDAASKAKALFYQHSGGKIKNLIVAGTITNAIKNTSTFGVITWNAGVTIDRCVSIVDISSDAALDFSAGGFIGGPKACTITNSVWAGKLRMPNGSTVSGMVGWVGTNSSSACKITNCIVVGEVNSSSGQAVAHPNGRYTLTNVYTLNPYSQGAIAGATYITSPDDVTSGKVAYDINTAAGSNIFFQTLGSDDYPVPFSTHAQVYANGQLKCDGTSAGGELKYSNTSESTIPPHTDEDGWCNVCGTLLTDHLTPNAQGYYELGSATDVKWFAAMVNQNGSITANAKLTADIDFDGVEYTPIGHSQVQKYMGEFDGQNHKIMNLTSFSQTNPVGFFGFLSANATDAAHIHNLIIDNTCVFSGENYIGGITGGIKAADGVANNASAPITIENCVNYASVTSSSGVASGFVGAATANYCKLTVRNCINAGTITATGNKGSALCSWQNNAEGIFENCLNIGSVSGTGDSKNLVVLGNTGSGERRITNCYDLCSSPGNVAITQGDQGNLTTATPLTSGELCYKLNGDQSDIIWTQTIGTDGCPTPFNKSEEVKYIGAAGYTTFYDSANDWKLNGDAQAYIGTISGNYLNLGEIDDIPAGTAVVIGGTYYNKLSTTATASTTGNILLGSDGTQKGGTGIYALANGTKGVGFYPVGSEVTIPKGKAYLVSPADVKGFTFVFDDDATGIENIEHSTLNIENSIYDLSGRRINSQFTIHNSQLPKGIYIVNGKKILK